MSLSLWLTSRLTRRANREPGSKRESKQTIPAPLSRRDSKSLAEEKKNPYHTSDVPSIPPNQEVLLLRAVKQSYQLVSAYSIPLPVEEGELLVKIEVIGLNPIDWKAPDYGFGIPELPYISGRDFVGTVIKAPSSSSRIREGDVVLTPSTDYRDIRKAAYQQYAIANLHNTSRVPIQLSKQVSASIGVAFVTAAIILGVCLGAPFHDIKGPAAGPDLLKILRSVPESTLPEDVRKESLEGISLSERARVGEWIAVWGGSSTTALFISQLSKLCGLRVLKIVDVAKHGARLSQRGADLLIDSHDVERASNIIGGVTENKLRLAVDCVGRTTATHLLSTLASRPVDSERAHLVGLTGLPKTSVLGVTQHSVPIKLFHELPQVGEALMTWLESLLQNNLLDLPDVDIAEGGLAGINAALDQMRRGEVSGKRIVVPLT